MQATHSQTTDGDVYSQLKAYSDGSESSTASRTMALKLDMSGRPSDDDDNEMLPIDRRSPLGWGASSDMVTSGRWREGELH